MECEVDGGDICSDISPPNSLIAPRQSFNEITGSYLANTFNRIDEKYSKTFVKLRRHSLDHVAKDLRRYPMSEFNQMIGSWSVIGKCSLRKGAEKRRHTVCGYSEMAVRSSEWGSGDGIFKENLCNCVLCTGSISEPRYEAGYIVRSEGAIHEISDNRKPLRKALPSKEPGDEQEFHPGKTSRATEDLKMKKHREPKPWYKIPRKRSHLEIADLVGTISHGQGKSAKLHSKNIARGFKKGSKLEACCDNDSCDDSNVYNQNTDIIEGNRHNDPETFLPTENCPITERIQKYLTSVVEDDKKGISLKKTSLCKEDLEICSSKDATTKKFKRNATVTKQSLAHSSTENSNTKERVTSALRHKYRHHVSSKRTKNHQRDAKSHEVREMHSLSEEGSNKTGQVLQDYSQKNKKFHRYNRNHLKDIDVALSDHSKTINDEDTSTWTYL